MTDLKRPASYVFVLPWDLSARGGVNQFVVELFREMESGGHVRPLVLVNRWESPRAVELSEHGRPTVHLRLRSPFEPGRAVGSFLRFLLFLPATLWRLRHLARRHGVAAFNPHYPGLGAWNFLLLRAAGLFRGKVILSFYGDDVYGARNSRGWERRL